MNTCNANQLFTNKYQPYTSNQITLHNDQSQAAYTIKSSLDNINRTVSVLPDGAIPLSLISALLGAIIASFAAWFFNLLQLRSDRKRREISYLANQAKNQIKGFESIAISYWSESKNEHNENSMKVLEVQMISELELIRATCQYFINKNPKPTLIEKIKPPIQKIFKIPTTNSEWDIQKNKLQKFMSDIYDISTGGEFKSLQREAHHKTVGKISRKCSSAYIILLAHINPT